MDSPSAPENYENYMILRTLNTNVCGMTFGNCHTFGRSTTVNFIPQVSRVQHVYFITINGLLLCGVARMTSPRTDGCLTVERMKKEEAEKKM